MFRLIRVSDHSILADSVISATTFGARLRGLMARPELPVGSAFLLDPCSSIHTCFMRFAIDVIFLDNTFMVTGVCCNVEPWRIRLAPRGTSKVIELPAGTIGPISITRHDQLILDNTKL